jgi:glutamine amidotransferase
MCVKPDMRVAIVDFGVGNIYSVRRAIEHCGAEVEVVSTCEQIESHDRLVLPGVGAFSSGMKELTRRGLDRAIVEHAAAGKPLLGICLGMQMLVDESHEFGHHKGLGLVGGSVEPVSAVGANGTPHKIPHVGWERVTATVQASESKLLHGMVAGSYFYFVHSFSVHLKEQHHCIALTSYDGVPIAAVLQAGSIFGCQFHPEKSGEAGLALLLNFLSI